MLSTMFAFLASSSGAALPDTVALRGGGRMPVVSNGAVTPLSTKFDAEEAAALEEWIGLGGRGVS